MWKHPFTRWLCTVPLYDLLIWLVFIGKAPRFLDGLAVPLLLGGLMLLGMIGGALWGGLDGLRRRDIVLYSVLSFMIFPLPYLFLDVDRWLALFCFFVLNGQQGGGFALGAWCRMAWEP